MNMQSVEGALGYDSYDLLGNRQSFVNSRNGRGASTPLPAEYTSFDQESGADLRIEYGTVPSFEVMLQAEVEEFLSACGQAAEQDVRARQEAEVAQSFLLAINTLHDNEIAFSGNTAEEREAFVEYVQYANPNASSEELTNLVYELIDAVAKDRAKLIAERESESTETTDSPQALVPRREVLVA